MEIDDTFRIDVPIDEAWRILSDIERVARVPSRHGAPRDRRRRVPRHGRRQDRRADRAVPGHGPGRVRGRGDAHRDHRRHGPRRPRPGQRLGDDRGDAPDRRRRHPGRYRHGPVAHGQGGPVRAGRHRRRVARISWPDSPRTSGATSWRRDVVDLDRVGGGRVAAGSPSPTSDRSPARPSRRTRSWPKRWPPAPSRRPSRPATGPRCARQSLAERRSGGPASSRAAPRCCAAWPRWSGFVLAAVLVRRLLRRRHR